MSTITILMLFALSAAKPSKEMKAELDSLQGDWVCVSIQREGKAFDSNGARLTVNGNRWTDKSNEGQIDFRIRLNPVTNPKQIGMTHVRPSDDDDVPPSRSVLYGGVVNGIYKLDGDTLTICHTILDRPKNFEAKQAREIVTVWKRAKK